MLYSVFTACPHLLPGNVFIGGVAGMQDVVMYVFYVTAFLLWRMRVLVHIEEKEALFCWLHSLST